MRWAKGRGVTYTVRTWRNELGVWRPGDLVPVRDEFMGFDERLLISDVQLIESESGRTAELRVCPPDAFAPVPMAEPKPKSGGDKKAAGWGWGDE